MQTSQGYNYFLYFTTFRNQKFWNFTNFIMFFLIVVFDSRLFT
jgi:hypothetical protein